MTLSAQSGRRPASLPRLFVSVSRPLPLWLLAACVLISGAAMLPAMSAMAEHGASLTSFELAGNTSRMTEILAGWGHAGKAAAWWQLALDTPFLIGYGLFLAGACTAVARRAERAGRRLLLRIAVVVAWFGPVAAFADLLQNVALALVLSGREVQPWPRISALAGLTTSTAVGAALAFALVGAALTRGAPSSEEIEQLGGVV